MIRRLGNKKGIIGKFITSVPVFIGIVFVMGIFLIITAMATNFKMPGKKAENTAPSVNIGESILWKEIEVSGEKMYLFEGFLKYRTKIEDVDKQNKISDEFTSIGTTNTNLQSFDFAEEIKRVMIEDKDYKNKESCLYISYLGTSWVIFKKSASDEFSISQTFGVIANLIYSIKGMDAESEVLYHYGGCLDE